jgi:hypothetical protein
MTSCRDRQLKHQAHEDQVFVNALDQNSLSLHAFDGKAEFLVKRDRDNVVFPNRQFDPMQPEGPSRVERLPHQTPAYSLPAEFRQHGDAENADMGINRSRVRHDIAPSDDLPARHRDQLRITLPDIVENEGPGLLRRRCFQKRQIAPLTGNEIERSMKAFDMVLRYRNNFD